MGIAVLSPTVGFIRNSSFRPLVSGKMFVKGGDLGFINESMLGIVLVGAVVTLATRFEGGGAGSVGAGGGGGGKS